MKGDWISEVDLDDFKKAWELRRVLPDDGYIDTESVKRIFKPDTDVGAAINRAAVLKSWTKVMPEILADVMDQGRPSEALLAVFARIPLRNLGNGESETFSVKDLLDQVKAQAGRPPGE